MFKDLTEQEKEIAFMLMQGQNCRTICEWLGIDYREYVKINKSVFRKLGIRRITQLLPLAIEERMIV